MNKYKIGSLVYIDYYSEYFDRQYKGFHIITGYNEKEYRYTIAPKIMNKYDSFLREHSLIAQGTRLIIE